MNVYDLREPLDIEFIPVSNNFSRGNNIQTVKFIYKNVEVYHTTVYWYNFLKEPTDDFCVDLILPDTTIVLNGKMNQMYEEEGYARPLLHTLQDTIDFINNYYLTIKN